LNPSLPNNENHVAVICNDCHPPSSIFNFDNLLFEKFERPMKIIPPFNCCDYSEICTNENKKENQLSNLPTPEKMQILPTNYLFQDSSTLPIEGILSSFPSYYTPDLKKEDSFCPDGISPTRDIVSSSYSFDWSNLLPTADSSSSFSTSTKSVVPVLPFLSSKIVSSPIPDNSSLYFESKIATTTSPSSSSSSSSLTFLMPRSMSAMIPMNRKNSFSASTNDKNRSFSVPVSGCKTYLPSFPFHYVPQVFLADGMSGVLNYLSCDSALKKNSQPSLLNDLNFQLKNNIKEDAHNNLMVLMRRNTASSMNGSKLNTSKDLMNDKNSTRDLLCKNLRRNTLDTSISSMFIICYYFLYLFIILVVVLCKHLKILAFVLRREKD
jgi:hypothetical protein